MQYGVNNSSLVVRADWFKKDEVFKLFQIDMIVLNELPPQVGGE